MNNPYSVYDATGLIVANGHTTNPDIAEQIFADGQAVLPVFLEISTHYAPGGVPTLRPKLVAAEWPSIAADGIAEVAFTDVPEGTRLRMFEVIGDRRHTYEGGWHVIADGSFEFVTAVPGIFEIVVEPPFPFQRQTITVTANAV